MSLRREAMKRWILIAMLLLAAAAAADDAQTEATNHLRRGKQLVEANCGDCMGARR